MITDFNINFTEKEISSIYQKIKDYPWNSISDLEGWEHGTNNTYLKELCDYWINEFDWQKHEVELNKFQNFVSNVDLEEYGISKTVKVTPTFIFVKDKTEVGRIEGYNGQELFWWQVDEIIKSEGLK